MRKSIVILVIVMIFATAFSTSPTTQAWDANVVLVTPNVRTNTTTSVTIRIDNTWIRDIYINSVNLSIDWPGGPKNVSTLDVPKSILAGGLANFQWSVTVPPDLPVGAKYNVTVDVNAAEEDENHQWGNTTAKTWMLEINIESSVIVIDGDDNFMFWFIPGTICIGLIILIIIISLIILIILLRRRRNP